MAFQNYLLDNNAQSSLTAWIWASALSIILKTWEWDLFPISNFPLCIETVDTSTWYVTSREIVLCTARAGDACTITRSFASCVQDDSADPKIKGTTAHSFLAWAVVSLYVSKEIIKDIQDEVSRINTVELPAKANDSEVVHNTGDETIAGIKTFSSSPIVPTPTTDMQTSTKKYVDDEILSSQDQYKLTNSNLMTWEDLVEWSSVFQEEAIELSDHSNDDQISLDSTSNASNDAWYRLQAIRDSNIVNVVKSVICTATKAYIKTDVWNTILATATFIWNVATFATPYSFNTNDYFRIEVDKDGSTYVNNFKNTPWFPKTATDIIYNTGSSNWSNDSSAWNIDSITTTSLLTPELLEQNIGDVASNTRVVIRLLWGWITDDILNLALAKVSSPSVDLWIRIETDSAGSPSWTPVNVNATATIAPWSLTTSLVDTIVTLIWNIAIPEWDVVRLILFAWTYWSETVNSSNYYKMWYSSKHTTTRYGQTWNGTELGTIIYTTDDDQIEFDSSTNIPDNRGDRLQAIYDLTVKTVNKSSSCTATKAYLKNDAGTLLATATFSWDVANFATPYPFNANDYFRIELGSDWASYTCRYKSSPWFPKTWTNIIYDTGSSSWSNHSYASNIDSIETWIFTAWEYDNSFKYVSSSLFADTLYSKTDAKYTYKLPDIPRIVDKIYGTGEVPKRDFKGISKHLTGLTRWDELFVSDTPWALSNIAGTNERKIWNVLESDELLISEANDVVQTNDDTLTWPAWDTSNSSTTYNKKQQYTIPVTGIYRVYYEYYVNSTSNNVYTRIYKNWVVHWTEKETNQTTPQTRSEDLSFNKWDTCELWVKNSNASYQWRTNNFALKWQIYKQPNIYFNLQSY